MNILVIGSGAREHALLWKLKQSPKVEQLFCAPGNGGTGSIATNVPIKADDVEGLLKFARTNEIGLTVVGPEVPLVKGIVDRFIDNDLVIFGPTAAAAALEGSKIFAKEFMIRHKIPTARYAAFDRTQAADAETFLRTLAPPIVLKADGLASGKGVLVCQTLDEALKGLEFLTSGTPFGSAGDRFIIEEFLVGIEASVFAICDGRDYVTLAPAQDHKRIFDGDRGKNTGGMGAYAPARIVTPAILERVKQTVIVPTLAGMRTEGHPFRGCLYCGLMLTEAGPKVLEYNCRFGDPETQVVLPLIDGDLAELLRSAAVGQINRKEAAQHKACAVGVVMASNGYPDEFEKGFEIKGTLDYPPEEGVAVFHAGTRKDGDRLLTDGGRVLTVTAVGYPDDLEGTIAGAYAAVGRIAFNGAYYRGDIGRKGLAT